MNFQELHIDKSWTLFLDRDGVINKKLDDNYVRTWSDFEFLPGAIEAISQLSKIFGVIAILTNQRGIGRNLYTISDLEEIHQRMTGEIEKAGGRIDGIFFCPHLGTEPECDCRKPKPGLALQAKNRFPEINFNRSVLVGDSFSDISLGKSLGMKTVLIGPHSSLILVDKRFQSLMEFAEEISKT